MENASKALIIAGAILLSILIIGLGMLVFNQARDAISGANLDAEKAEAFNSKFMAYTGDGVTGPQVKSLLDLVVNNNQTTTTTENEEILVYNNTTKITDISSFRNKFKNATKYKVVVTEHYTNGHIKTIKITKVDGTAI